MLTGPELQAEWSFLQPVNLYPVTGANTTNTVSAVALASIKYQWQSNSVSISGATNATFIVTNVQTAANFRVIVTNGAGSVTSSTAGLTLITSPFILSQSTPLVQWVKEGGSFSVSVTACGAAGCGPLGYQWRFNGTNISGATSSGYTNSNALSVNEGAYSVVVSNAAGTNLSLGWQVGVTTPGRLVGWGNDIYGQIDFPAATNDFVAIAVGDYHSVAARENGTVVFWGTDFSGQTTPPDDATNVIAVAAAVWHSLALKSDGHVVAWGFNSHGQTTVPADVSNVVAISAGSWCSYALLSNHTVRQWGFTNAGVPADLTNAIAISAGYNYCLALRSNGTVAAWGAGPTPPGGLSNVVAVAAGAHHCLALTTNGTLIGWGANTFGQINTSGISNVMAIAAGWQHSVALKNDGTVVTFGYPFQEVTNVPTPLTSVTNSAPVKLIAAGAFQTIAGVFSPTNQYPVDVTKDLLLIYNTNSAGSSNVCAYYLANRPLVSNANVLPIGCTNTESFLPSEYTNVFVAQIGNWLAGNPTKRPQYVILFLDIPSRVNTNRPPPNEAVIDYGKLPSVSYSLATQFAGWQPFVSHINMGTTNDCIAYIDKLKYFGETYSPGKLVISASSLGSYGNTNYVLDGIRHHGNYTNGVVEITSSFPSFFGNGGIVSSATNALLNAGVATNAILFFDGLDTFTNAVPPPFVHPGPQTNIAGYMCWGGHSLLGGAYPTDGKVTWSGDSRWWIIETVESFNGQRDAGGANFIKWFSTSAFGGSNYSNTPVGAVSHVDEPSLPGVNSAAQYFGLWASGKNFGIAAWNSRITAYFQAVGDPFTKK